MSEFLYPNILAALSVTSIIAIVVWGVVIVVSLIAEFNTADLTAIWFCVGAIPSLICAIFEVGIGIQILVFGVLSVILVLATRPLVKKFNKRETIATNVDKIIGMVGKVVKTIEPDEKGEVKVNYQLWTAISSSSVAIEEGSDVVVKEVVGNKLVVEKIEEINL